MASVAPQLASLHGEPQEIDAPDETRLVTEDDAPLDSILTEKQERLLSRPLYASWSGPPPGEEGVARPFVVLANVGLFSTPEEEPVVPDLMLSLDVTIPEDLGEKKNRSYFLWRYGKPPDIVVEIVSNKKGGELGTRRARYARMRVPYYVVYDPLGALGEVPVRAFELNRSAYVALVRPWFEEVGLGLAEWEGSFERVQRHWLRWCTRDGKVLPTGEERATNEKARAETAEARAETAEARADRLAARLRGLGIEPDP